MLGLPDVVHDQQASSVLEEARERFLERVDAGVGSRYVPIELLDPFVQPSRQVGCLTQSAPENATGEGGLDLGVVAERPRDHALARPTHAVQRNGCRSTTRRAHRLAREQGLTSERKDLGPKDKMRRKRHMAVEIGV